MPLLRSKLVISAGSQHRRGMPSRVRLLLVAGATAVLALVLGSGANASSIWGDSRRGGDQGGSVVGPSVCQSDNTTLGYNDTTALFYDALAMSSGVLAGDQKQGAGIEFVLCPGTIFDLGTDLVASSSDTTQSQDMLGLIPLLDHTHYRCGSDGSPSNDCILRGGWYHVLFEDDLPVVNTTFLGLTFEGTLDVSVMGYGLPTNSAAFINCRWRNNGMGRYLVDNFWHLHLQGGIVEPGSRRMGPRERSRTRERQAPQREEAVKILPFPPLLSPPLSQRMSQLLLPSKSRLLLLSPEGRRTHRSAWKTTQATRRMLPFRSLFRPCLRVSP